MLEQEETVTPIQPIGGLNQLRLPGGTVVQKLTDRKSGLNGPVRNVGEDHGASQRARLLNLGG